MKNVFEKEKKLIEALEKLDSIKIGNSNSMEEIETLENQKNQLEIEKNEIEQRYNTLQQENAALKQKFDDFKK